MQDSNLRPLACRAGGYTPLPYPVGATVSVEFDESNEQYHADLDYLNSSRVRDFIELGPAGYAARHVRQSNTPSASEGMQWGTLVHQWMELGEAEFRRQAVVMPLDFVTDGGAISQSAKAKKWLAENALGASILVTEKQLPQLSAQAAAIFAEPKARELLDAVQWREFSVRWQHPNGHLLRVRCDAATPECWIDLKTTKEARPSRDWWKSVRAFGYGLQSAMYRWAARECGWPCDRIHYVVSSNASHECFVGTLPDAYVDACERRVLRALEEIESRSLLDHWLPDDHGRVVEISMPGFTLED